MNRPVPSQRRRPEFAWLALALVATAASLGLRLLWVSAISDDGLTFANGASVAAGKVPYRDFFLATPPGVVALYGALFKVTGIGYMPGRVLTATSVLLSVAALWDLGRRLAAPHVAAVVAGLYGTWTATFLFFQPHHFWSMTFPFAVAWALVRARISRTPQWWAIAGGLLGGLAMLSDQTAGLPVLVALVAAALFLGVRAAALPFFVGAISVGVATLAWAVLVGASGEMWRQVVVYPATTFRGLTPVLTPFIPAWVADLGPPVYSTLPLQRLIVWLAGFVGGYLVCGVALVAVLRRRRIAPEMGLTLLIAAGIDLATLFVRPTGPFLWMCAGLNLVLFGVLVSNRAAPPVAIAVAALFSVMAVMPLAQGISDGCGPGASGVRVNIPATGSPVCVLSAEAASMHESAAFGRRHSGEGVAYLSLIAPSYTLAGEVPPVAYVWVAPDVLTGPDLAQLEQQLASSRVGWVVSAPRIETAGLRSGSPQTGPDGRWTLDDYIDQNFEVAGHCGEWALYRSRRFPPQSPAPCAQG